ncbi:MAG: phage portal protein [Pigmentiphaga sp.]|nr:phage portal protein [Pigmentiphaga sp.]
MGFVSFIRQRVSALAEDERAVLAQLSDQLARFQGHNRLVADYYDQRARIRDFGISIPPHIRGLADTTAGWPATVVDVLEERLDHNGWIASGGVDNLGIADLVEENQLNGEFSKGHLDALIYGIAFGVVGRGDDGEPEVLVTVESPIRMTGIWSRRRRALESALYVNLDNKKQPDIATLYLPGETIELVMDGGRWTVESRAPHSIDGVPCEPIVNRPRAGDTGGRSEITRAIRYYTDNAVRTLLGGEIAREFYGAPQRWAMGADEKSFVDQHGNPLTAWESYLGKIMALPRDENGDLPQVGSFAAGSPEPFIAWLRQLSMLVAAEAGMSATYLGLIHDNPASADAIRAADVRLEKRAERRQRIFGAAEGRLMRKALWVRDGRDPGVTPLPMWRDAGTPTRSAQAQDAVALVTAGILPSDSDITYERIGLSEPDRQRIRADLRRSRMVGTISALAAAAELAREGDET